MFTFYASQSPTSTSVNFYKRPGSNQETMLTLTNSGSSPYRKKQTSIYAAPGKLYDKEILPSFSMESTRMWSDLDCWTIFLLGRY